MFNEPINSSLLRRISHRELCHFILKSPSAHKLFIVSMYMYVTKGSVMYYHTKIRNKVNRIFDPFESVRAERHV